MNRRLFLQKLVMTSGLGIVPNVVFSDDDDSDRNNMGGHNVRFTLANTDITNQHVIVVGGGMAGATVAKYLRLWGGAGVQVTLIEPNPIYVSNIMSNLVLSAGRSMTSLNFTYTQIANHYGVTIKRASLVSFNNTNKTVVLSDNTTLSYDRLIMAPGIQLDDAYGLTEADYNGNYPHAWQAGQQTTKLASLISTMNHNDTFIMSIPAKPYRCPPGPYERACLIADYLKSHGKTGTKVIVLDENVSVANSALPAPYHAIQAEQHSFHTAFTQIHHPIIEYYSGVTNIHLTHKNGDGSGTVSCSAGAFSGKVISLIPPHRAPSLISSLCNGGRWAPVNVLTYESTIAGMSGVHIIGDASQTTQPKAGHMANQEAKVCADAIIRAFQRQSPDTSPVTNSACYSPITNTTASWLTGVYQYDPNTQTMRLWSNGTFRDAPVEADSITNKNFSRMNTWFNTLMRDSFG